MKMFRIQPVAALLALGISLAFASQGAAQEGPVEFDKAPKHLIMIMLDGFRPDYVAMYGPPNLARLVREGVWAAEAESVFPPNTTPNQTSFVTGSLPATTGIPNNSRYDRERDTVIGPLRDNRVPTIAEILREHGWTTASVNHFMLQGRGVERYVRGDIDALIRMFETNPPGLAVYYNDQIDAAGHSHGPFSPETRAAVLKADEEIGRLMAALERLGLADETAIVVASDHGMSPNDGRPITPTLASIFQSLGLRVATESGLIRPDTHLVYIQIGSAYLYWRNGMRTPELEQRLLERLRAVDGARVLTEPEIRALGADPERLGDIVIVPEPYRAITGGSGTGGIHGTPSEGQILLLFWGTGFKKGHVIHRASMVDIVPTLLSLVRVDVPASVDGRVLTEALERPANKMRLGVAGDYPVRDVAASGYYQFFFPANAADGSVYTAWASPEKATEGSPHYLAFDYGVRREFKSFEIVAVNDSRVLGPKDVVLEVSDDGRTYREVFSGTIAPIKGGETARIELDRPVYGRYLRLLAWSGHESEQVRIAELRAYGSREPAPGAGN